MPIPQEKSDNCWGKHPAYHHGARSEPQLAEKWRNQATLLGSVSDR